MVAQHLPHAGCDYVVLECQQCHVVTVSQCHHSYRVTSRPAEDQSVTEDFHCGLRAESHSANQRY